MINIDSTYGDELEAYFSSDSTYVLLISPFISIDALCRVIGGCVNASIITSWREDHLRSGYSTLETFPLCRERGWKLYMNNRIHAKIYSRSMTDCYIGSANCTNRALFDPEGNIEAMVFVPHMTAEDRIELYRLLSKSTLITEEIYESYKIWYESIEDQSTDEVVLPVITRNNPFTIMELPATDDPESLWRYYVDKKDGPNPTIEHDLAYFGPSDMIADHELFMTTVKERFFTDPFIQRASEQVTEDGISFGAMTGWIHDNCMDVPTPYRKDIKALVHNIFHWFESLDPDHYRICIPGRHSQVLFKL